MAQFIQEATSKHKGALRMYAKEHHLMNKKGNIELHKTKAYIERNETGATKTKRLREVNLAINLRRLRV